VHQDLAWLNESTRQKDKHAVNPRELPQSHALVRNTVLCTDHWYLASGGSKVVERSSGVLRLHGEKDDIVIPKLDARRVADRCYRQSDRLVRRKKSQAVLLQFLQVPSTADQYNAVACLM
jgi:hypothetical protein